MTYLSRVWLNPLRPATQALLRNPEKMHAAVLGGLARQPVTERVLWRLEAGQPYRAEILILTESTPSWEHLVEQAGWPHADEPQALVRDYQPLLDCVVTGRDFRFRLRANPVQNVLSSGRRAARKGHRTAGHQVAWLTSRVEKWGLKLIGSDNDNNPALRLSARERVVFHKKAAGGEGRGHRVVINTATFDGAVRVTDPHRARKTLLDGAGAGKAYGCGLLTLTPFASTATPVDG